MPQNSEGTVKLENYAICREKLQLRLEYNFIDETPQPVLSGFDGLHDGMFRGVEMFCRVLVFRRIAAADMATLPTEPQVNPTIAHLQAFLAALGVGMHFLNVAGVRTGGAHASSFFAS